MNHIIYYYYICPKTKIRWREKRLRDGKLIERSVVSYKEFKIKDRHERSGGYKGQAVI